MFACDGCKNSSPVDNGNGGKIWCCAQRMIIAVNPINDEHVSNCTFFEKD